MSKAKQTPVQVVVSAEIRQLIDLIKSVKNEFYGQPRKYNPAAYPPLARDVKDTTKIFKQIEEDLKVISRNFKLAASKAKADKKEANKIRKCKGGSSTKIAAFAAVVINEHYSEFLRNTGWFTGDASFDENHSYFGNKNIITRAMSTRVFTLYADMQMSKDMPKETVPVSATKSVKLRRLNAALIKLFTDSYNNGKKSRKTSEEYLTMKSQSINSKKSAKGRATLIKYEGHWYYNQPALQMLSMTLFIPGAYIRAGKEFCRCVDGKIMEDDVIGDTRDNVDKYVEKVLRARHEILDDMINNRCEEEEYYSSDEE